MKMKFKDFLKEEIATADAATTTADVAQYKRRIGGDYGKEKTDKSSIVINITSEDKEKEIEFLKNLVDKYQDRGIILNTQLGSNEGNVEIVLPHHLIDEIQSKLEKRKNLEIV